MDETGAHYIDKDILFQTPFHYSLLQVLDSCAHLYFYLLTPRVAGFYNSNSCSPHWKTTELKKKFWKSSLFIYGQSTFPFPEQCFPSSCSNWRMEECPPRQTVLSCAFCMHSRYRELYPRRAEVGEGAPGLDVREEQTLPYRALAAVGVSQEDAPTKE